MSFKKTPDGKVFFKGAPSNANTSTAREEAADIDEGFGAGTFGTESQLQILALLRSLNEKLKTTQNQHERMEARLETFRTLLESLDNRTQANERALSTMDKKLREKTAANLQEARIDEILLDTRKELEKTRQIFLQGSKKNMPDSAYREALGGLARAETLLTSHKTSEEEENARRADSFSLLYAVALSLFLISGAIFLWGITGYNTDTAGRGSATGKPAFDINDEASLREMMESDPDALAAKLNELEPSSVNRGVHGLIDPDSRLPRTYKEMEEQAFTGSAEAQHNLAALYTAADGPVKQNYERAAFWFRQAAERGMANAQYNLGVMYHQGLGVEADPAQAVNWYRAAAAQGHAEAQYNLGIAYVEGVGVEYDPVKAVENFEKAAAQGVVEASYNLGLIYENALLGRPDPSHALAWYKKAADGGSPEAQAALEQLAKTLDIRVEDIDRVVKSVEDSSG